jgi:hypothetical protein
VYLRRQGWPAADRVEESIPLHRTAPREPADTQGRSMEVHGPGQETLLLVAYQIILERRENPPA